MFKFGGSQTFTIGCYSYKIVLVTVNMNVHFILQEYVSPIHVRTQDRVFPVTRTVLNVTVLKGLLESFVTYPLILMIAAHVTITMTMMATVIPTIYVHHFQSSGGMTVIGSTLH